MPSRRATLWNPTPDKVEQMYLGRVAAARGLAVRTATTFLLIGLAVPWQGLIARAGARRR
ncbi:MAG: hypothetical protein M3019_04340 [Candidatus Dormibacteraeota bacterium]|nr:hypothetical protein [Candidatus Dormibacteraeota bacterium]